MQEYDKFQNVFCKFIEIFCGAILFYLTISLFITFNLTVKIVLKQALSANLSQATRYVT